jgi:hypothetical protein
MLLVTQGDKEVEQEAQRYLDDWAVRISERVFVNIDDISPTTIIVSDILHTIHLGMLKPLVDCVMSFLEQHSRIDKWNQLKVMMPPLCGFAWFNKPYSTVTQWSGRDMKALGRLIVPVLRSPVEALWQAKRYPSQMTCWALRTFCIVTLWNNTGPILRLQSSAWRMICRR